VHTLGARLRGAEYSEDEDEDLYGDEDAPAPTKKVHAFLSLISHNWRVAQGAKPFTYADALHTIQASPAELDAALAAQHILNLNGTLRPLAPAYLARILQLTLALLVAAGWAPGGAGAPAGELARTLEAEHGVRREVATQVMAWFGGVEGDVWSVDVDAVVREVGLGVLRTYQVRPSSCYTGRVAEIMSGQNERVEEDVYMDKWKDAVGDAFADRVALSLLPVRLFLLLPYPPLTPRRATTSYTRPRPPHSPRHERRFSTSRGRHFLATQPDASGICSRRACAGARTTLRRSWTISAWTRMNASGCCWSMPARWVARTACG
jgi:hypothetical protein